MTILHLRSSDLFGSPERLIIGQCRHLPQFQFICGSYARNNVQPKFLTECANSGIPTVALHESFPGDLRVIPQLRDIIKSKKVDLIVSHDYKSTFYSYWATNGLPTNRIAYYHGVTSEDFKVKVYNAIDTFMLKRTPRVIAVSEHTKRLLIHRGIATDKISVVPNAVDTATLPTTPPNRSESGPVKLIGAGRFSYEKGFDILVEAIACIPADAPPFVVYLYGQGPEEDRLRELVKTLKQEDRIQFMGFVADIRSVFKTMDALVMSSRSEGMPLIILEAWAERLGVLATTVGGIPEMIIDGQSGIVVPPYDITALSTALRHTIDNRKLMWRFGEEGNRILRERYSLTRQAILLNDIYISTSRK